MVYTPFEAVLDAQTEAYNTLSDATRRAPLLAERAGEIASIDVGPTPAEVVYTENKLELLHYEPRTDDQNDVPILIVYALINRPYILDLQPERSVVRRLLDDGHDVYLIDWNEPSRLDQHLSMTDYVTRYIDNCVDEVRARSGADAINILGYCMGGTLTAMYTALYTEKVNALGLMAAGLCFDDTGGVLERWGSEETYDPRTVTETFGNMPDWYLDDGFAMMDPVDNYLSKYITLYENIEDDDFVANFARMERWLSEGIDLAGNTYAEFLEKIYQNNELYRGTLELGDRTVDPADIDVPLLQILGEYDHLIPPAASKPFNDVVGSDDITTIEYPTGHIGLSVSSSSHREVWPEVSAWYHDRSGGTDIETIDGIGPTFAQRLRQADIETTADLADHDAATLADIADTSESRTRAWLEQV